MAHQILVPIDLDSGAVFESVFSTVADQARLHDSRIILLSVVPKLTLGYFPSIEARYMRKLVAETKRQLAALATEQLGSDFSWLVEVAVGTPAPEIIRVADAHHVDLIVMASHNPRRSDFFFGSVADRVVRHALHSVLVVRQSRRAEVAVGAEATAAPHASA